MTLEQFNQQYGHDPQFLQLLKAANDAQQQYGASGIMTPAGQAYQQFLKSKGVDIHNTLTRPTADGGVELYDTHPGREFAKDAAISAAVAGGGALAASALAPSAAATGITTGPTLAQAAGTTAAAGAGGGSLLHSLLPSIIGAGSTVAGTAIASHANTEAAKIAAEQADKALAIQQQQYALQRQDTAPYRALGIGAVNNLGFLGGIDTTSNLAQLSSTLPTGPNAPPSTVVAPGAVDASGKPIPGAGANVGTVAPPTPAQQRMTSLNQLGGGTVRIQDPQTGLVHLIPQSDAAAAQQAGGRLV